MCIDVTDKRRGPDVKHLTAGAYRKMYGKKLFQSYFKFAVVRNPYDRLLSYYCFKFKIKKNRNDLNICESHFAGFVKQQKTQQCWLSKSVHLVRFENLVAGLKALEVFEGVTTFDDFPVLNASANSNWDWQQVYTQRMRDAVYLRHRSDFETLGYSR